MIGSAMSDHGGFAVRYAFIQKLHWNEFASSWLRRCPSLGDKRGDARPEKPS